jgi:hypothetical protein
VDLSSLTSEYTRSAQTLQQRGCDGVDDSWVRVIDLDTDKVYVVQEPSTGWADAAAPSAPPPGAQTFDDPHVRTLGGQQYFLHGIGVFEYASIEDRIRTQVYMCPTADCTKEQMQKGDCLTFIQAVAIQIDSSLTEAGSGGHLIVMRNSSVKIDYEDRKSEANIILGKATSINATGVAPASSHQARRKHDTLANCHVLPTAGQHTEGTVPYDASAAPSHVGGSLTEPRLETQQAAAFKQKPTNPPTDQLGPGGPDVPFGGCGDDCGHMCKKGLAHKLDYVDQAATDGGEFACCPASCGSCTSHNGCEDRGAHDQCCSYKLVAANKKCVHPNSVGCIFGSGKAYAWGSVSGNIDRAGWGGVWKYCTNNEWSLASPVLSIDIGVIGPFEEGFLNEEASDRTFNLNVNHIKGGPMKGIVNGDKNGLFVLDPNFNEGTSSELVPGVLVPEGPHGNVQEVTAPNVAAEEVLFPAEVLAKMDAACGPQKALRALRLQGGGPVSDELKRAWRSRARSQGGEIKA